ncbi:hypothetical protein F2Q69_00000514 [Brassica cretica]|uniref:Non-reducing end beta-L-arabinofuranosidase-like GH127 catalytic domain-containing protein n=1 Tax=Brassica cretica TaxID=69181 RepID=A0A8S9PGT5_BRACR|nr:hypothetical protein F2Q69_00000514 [Brassica cretica]
MSALVSALSTCQQKLGTGYLSAFPSSFFDRFEAITPILAGLVDQYKLAGNTQALKMATWMGDYFYGRVRNVIKTYSVERHWQSLNEETGGMNDVLYQIYSITGDSKYLLLAHLFDKPCFLGVLAVQADDISGFHSNTHIPIVVGSQLRYEITGDPLHKEISMFFMDIVNASHSYATGGTSVNEFWQDPKRMATTLQTENEESCTTYNMLKVSRNLFRWTKEVSYADYYERALTNGVLGIQRGTEPGLMIYMLPLGKGVSKAVTYHGWGTPYDSFWCCYGTGIESFSKLGDSIYFQEDGESPALYVIQYISSSLDWKSTGHYLSATAYMWASTHNNTLKEKMSALVSALSTCQQKLGTGYLSAFPSSFFDRFEAITPILAGLVDQYKLAGNSQALKMATWMADYFYGRVRNVIKTYSVERHWQSLNEETGGMNDVLYQIYSITGDSKYLLLAHLFDKPCFLGVLAVQADDISGFHSNTHIPIVVGSQLRYEITGDPLHKEISMFFMDIVNASHSYATGGTSVNEFWQDPKRMATTLQTENEESCTTYNMLKVSRNLFRWTKEVSYADYYERALTNGVLGIQRGTEPGLMIYMLPLGKGVSKAVTYHGWGTPYDSFWCCYGTGIESFSKLGDSIYFQEDGESPALYVTQMTDELLTCTDTDYRLQAGPSQTNIILVQMSWSYNLAPPRCLFGT